MMTEQPMLAPAHARYDVCVTQTHECTHSIKHTHATVHPSVMYALHL